MKESVHTGDTERKKKNTKPSQPMAYTLTDIVHTEEVEITAATR